MHFSITDYILFGFSSVSHECCNWWVHIPLYWDIRMMHRYELIPPLILWNWSNFSTFWSIKRPILLENNTSIALLVQIFLFRWIFDIISILTELISFLRCGIIYHMIYGGIQTNPCFSNSDSKETSSFEHADRNLCRILMNIHWEFQKNSVHIRIFNMRMILDFRMIYFTLIPSIVKIQLG